MARGYLAPAGRALLLANRDSKLCLNAAAAPALSITIKSLSWRLRPDAEKFAAPVRSNRPSIVHQRACVLLARCSVAGAISFGTEGERQWRRQSQPW
jgi:hypothetical protein